MTPWAWSHGAEEGEATVHSLNADGVLCRWWGGKEPNGARLIAAAPALLAACEAMFATMSPPLPGRPKRSYEKAMREWRADRAKAVEAARAALASARAEAGRGAK